MIVVFVCMLIVAVGAGTIILAIYCASMTKIDYYSKNIESISIIPYTFTVGDRIRRRCNTNDNVGHYIVDIREGYYWCDAGITIPHSCQDQYEKF